MAAWQSTSLQTRSTSALSSEKPSATLVAVLSNANRHAVLFAWKSALALPHCGCPSVECNEIIINQQVRRQNTFISLKNCVVSVYFTCWVGSYIVDTSKLDHVYCTALAIINVHFGEGARLAITPCAKRWSDCIRFAEWSHTRFYMYMESL